MADAYNHRIQVFDFQGNSIQIFGNEEEMNASTGIFLSDDKIFITDFENGRVLIYDYSGSLKQILDQGINKPTDILIYNEDLLITDFESSALVRYVLKWQPLCYKVVNFLFRQPFAETHRFSN